MKRILVTGGAGFVGSTLALALKRRHPSAEITVLDNLKRRGSELLLARLQAAEIRFVHGDVRIKEDFPAEPYDLLIECSAEPSVLAGYTSSPDYLLQTNLQGAIHCLEYCRKHGASLIFLSTSRVYSVAPLTRLKLLETETRFELAPDQIEAGASEHGVAESFTTLSHRSLYGATKLAAEMLIEEYRQAYGMQAVVNRCGVLAGPWQLARGDQGVFTFWLASHYFDRPLNYIGFGGHGKQVRDLLHAEDLAELVLLQMEDLPAWNGTVLNVSGGRDISLSLRETTALCAEITGRKVAVTPKPEPRPMDIPIYIGDSRQLYSRTSWRPRHSARDILVQTFDWIRANESLLEKIL